MPTLSRCIFCLCVGAFLLLACGGDDGATDGGREVPIDVPTRPIIPGCDNPTDLGGLSARCACDTDCRDDLRCTAEDLAGLVGGLCSRSCELDRDCGETGRCVAGFCMAGCVSTDQCPDSRMCSRGVCFPHCTDSSQCRTGACNPYTGDCEPDLAYLDDLRENNAACTSDSQCRSEQCVAGYCLGYCMRSRQDCPDGNVCGANTYVVRANDQGICYLPCAEGETCTMDTLRCGPTPGVPGEPFSCRP